MKRERTGRDELIEAYINRQPLTRNRVLLEVAGRIVDEFELCDGRELTVREILRLVHGMKTPVEFESET